MSGDLADEIESVEDGLQQIWPLVAGAYARVWDAERPPSVADLGFTTQANSHLDSPGVLTAIAAMMSGPTRPSRRLLNQGLWRKATIDALRRR